MSTELAAAVWRLQSETTIEGQRLVAADLIEEFYDDVTLKMIAQVLRGEKQKTDLPRRQLDMWAFVKVRMSDGLRYEEAVQEASKAFLVGDKTIEASYTKANKLGMTFN